ncbi:NAD-dependent protein deacetylase [Luteimonas sp. SDU101]|uniref:NAD-dependent protein deacetylase n=1 Tax=Luteimonas sp. SDU101 TaxID=3422593 RepID=UPI003EBB4F33
MSLTTTLAPLRGWIRRHERIFVLTGAGCSTGSGIPDYRDRDGEWKRTPPITLQALTGSDAAYRRYWARSSIGWPRFHAARPNPAHAALAKLERSGRVRLLLTQNVDGLHQRAGSERVIDLHGRLDAVVCLGCGARSGREQVQAELLAINAGWQAGAAGMAPDGDADLADDAVAGFVPPWCGYCRGLLKPDVVFFGEAVPRERVEEAQRALHAADAMLVAGSSLMVWSGFRFVRMAAAAGIPIAILNAGRTRADHLATLRIDADIASSLQEALE